MKLRLRTLIAGLFAALALSTAFAGTADAWGGCITTVNPDTLELETLCY